MITNNKLPVDFVKNIGIPASKLVISGVATYGRTDAFCIVDSGCYCMKHKDANSKKSKECLNHDHF